MGLPPFGGEAATFVNQIYQRADGFLFSRRTYGLYHEDSYQYEVTACAATSPALWAYITGLTGKFRTRSDPASTSEPAPAACTPRGQVTAHGARWPAWWEYMTGLTG
jgi:hypothetical protein